MQYNIHAIFIFIKLPYPEGFSEADISDTNNIEDDGTTVDATDSTAYHDSTSNRHVARGGSGGSDEPPFQTRTFLNVAI